MLAGSDVVVITAGAKQQPGEPRLALANRNADILKAVLPDPKSLGANYHGQTSIGCRIRGVKDGKEHTYYIYNNCDHEQAYKETGTQAVSFTTGVTAALGAAMWAKGLWRGAGVFNVEEFDPDPFLAELGEQGLPWHELFDVDIDEDTVDTVGGLIGKTIGRVQILGSTCEVAGLRLTAERMSGRRHRIATVVVERVGAGEQQSEQVSEEVQETVR